MGNYFGRVPNQGVENKNWIALIYMNKPSKDGKSIDRASQYIEGMNVHHSRGVYNRFFYLTATKPNWNVRKTFKLMAKANMDFWTPNSTFNEGACGVLSAAKSLKFTDSDINDIKQAMRAVEL